MGLKQFSNPLFFDVEKVRTMSESTRQSEERTR